MSYGSSSSTYCLVGNSDSEWGEQWAAGAAGAAGAHVFCQQNLDRCFQQLVSARLQSGDFIFIFTVMSHDRLAVPSGGLVLWIYIHVYKRSGDLGIWSVGYRETV